MIPSSPATVSGGNPHIEWGSPGHLGQLPVIAGPSAGRPLLIRDSTLYIGRRGAVLRTEDAGRSWAVDCTLGPDLRRSFAGRSRLLSRLLRLDIMALRVLDDGARLAIARDGIYRAESGETRMRRTFRFAAGRPLNLAVDGRGRVVFGEYRSNPERGPIRVYASDDSGGSFEVTYEFAAGEIRHVHSITWDPHLERCLVITGDYEQECGIGVMGADLEGVDWLVRGGQRFRAASILVDEQFITYGTDSHVEGNEILQVEKATGRCRSLGEVEGSSLYAANFGGVRAISTAVEPSTVNHSREVALYLSRDGERWNRTMVARKDRWHPLLQFGTFVLPHVEGLPSFGAVGGQALAGLDGQTWIMFFGEAHPAAASGGRRRSVT
jgi:hypothetical protein